MALFKRKDQTAIDIEDLSEQLDIQTENRHFFLTATRALLVFLKDFAIELRELDVDRYRKDIDRLTQTLTQEEKLRRLESAFERHKKKIIAFIAKQKTFLKAREGEFKDIIALLTKAMGTLDADNQAFNQKLYSQSDQFEQLAHIDDLRRIKRELRDKVSTLRRTVQDKQSQDKRRISRLSAQVSVLNQELDRAKSESRKDALTQIHNRRAFDDFILDLVERNTIRKAPFALLLIDIDDFKIVNDNYGHQIGDRVLVAAATQCKSMIRSDDFIARYGGEEFGLILPNASLRQARKRAEKLCKKIAATKYGVEEKGARFTLSFTISIGVAVYRQGDTTTTIIKRADDALYGAKGAGKNCVLTEKQLQAAA